jgi:ribosomal protein S18 acetylase RimI-like enzyme
MLTTLPAGFVTRPATIEDVEAAVNLVNACSIELIGKPEFEADRFRADWSSPSLNPATDLHLVFTRDEKLVGYGGVWDSEPYVQLFGWGNVHPEYMGRGIGTCLARWVEERASQAIPLAPDGARVVLLQSKLSIDTAAQDLLRQQGYQAVRYALRMRIAMGDPSPEPTLPLQITISPFDREKQMQALILAIQDIFKDHWGYVEHSFEDDYAHWVHWIDHNPDHDPSLWFLALDGDEIVGVSLCRPRIAEDPNVAYVNTLGVRRPWRRRGIALALLHHSFGELYRRGRRIVALDVDAQNLTGATRLYEKAGMHVQRQAVTFEKELRPGAELRTQSVEA